LNTFDWEAIEEYVEITGIAPIDKALAYLVPMELLKQHFRRREDVEGRGAVIADLETTVASPALEEALRAMLSEWLERYRNGAAVEDLWPA
jgi:hypothetical protein